MNFKIVLSVLLIFAVLVISFQLTGFSIADQKPVKIGYIPLATSLNLYVAEANNYFEDAGIKYELVKMESSGQLAATLSKGDVDAAFEVLTAPLLVEEAKNPGSIKLFSVSDLTTAKPFDSIIVKDNSINSLNDLEGKKIGVTPGSVFNSQLLYFLKFKGVDTGRVLTEPVGLADQIISLSNNQVDAIYSIEPVAETAVSEHGFRRLYASVFANTINHSPQGAAALSSNFLSENPEFAKKIVDVFDKSVDFIRSDEGAARGIAGHRLNLPAEVSGNMGLFYMVKSSEIDTTVLTQQIRLYEYLGELDADGINLNELIYR